MKTTIKLIIVLMILLSTMNYELRAGYAEIPPVINYQGRLTDAEGAPLDNTTVDITFRIYDDQNAGAPLWQEPHSGVVIEKGLFSVLLGSQNDLELSFDQPYFLEVEVEGEIMGPRQALASAPYAFTATSGVPRGVIVMWSGLISEIPGGWALCDGTNGTPDLRGRFVKGVPDASTNPGATGGASTHDHSGKTGSHALTIAEIPAHTHVYNTWTYYGVGGDGEAPRTSNPEVQKTSGSKGGGGGHPHTIVNASSLPPYYEIAYIMKL